MPNKDLENANKNTQTNADAEKMGFKYQDGRYVRVDASAFEYHHGSKSNNDPEQQ